MTCNESCKHFNNGKCEKYNHFLKRCTAEWNLGLYEKYIICEIERKRNLIRKQKEDWKRVFING